MIKPGGFVKATAALLAFLLSFEASAGYYFDTYQSQKIETAMKFVRVEKVDADILKLSTICVGPENERNETECEQPLLMSEFSLRLINIRERIEQLKIFNKPEVKETRKQKFARRTGKALAIMTFLIPGLGPFLSLGVGVAGLYAGLYAVALTADIAAEHEAKSVAPAKLLPELLAGSAGTVLKALNEEVKISRYDRSDALGGLRENLLKLYEGQRAKEQQIMAEISHTDALTAGELAQLKQKFSTWKTQYIQLLAELKANPKNDFDDLINTGLYQNQIDLMDWAIAKADALNSKEDGLYLKLLAGQFEKNGR